VTIRLCGQIHCAAICSVINDAAEAYRRLHPALVWTGHGRTVPRIVLRKGSVVHRDVLAQAPTGFAGGPEGGTNE